MPNNCCTPGKTNNCTEKGTCGSQASSIEVEEEKWDLPKDFDLFSKHELRKIYYPNVNDDDDNRHSFEIECLEPSSPLDVINKSESENQYDATGHCVWTGAFLLIQCMDELLSIVSTKNKRIIELGCGTGIGGLGIILASKETKPDMVCFTDADPAVLEVCRRNCDLNELAEDSSYSIRQLTWGEGDASSNMGTFDVALATDVLYDIDLCSPIFTTVSQCIPVGAPFILSHVPRACYNEGNPPEAIENLEQYIIDRAKEHGLHLEIVIRPPHQDELQEELLSWYSKDAFSGSGILIFRKTDNAL